MEEQLREYILSGNKDEKQFLIDDQVVTVNPNKTQDEIEKEIEEEIQRVINDEKYYLVFLDLINKKEGVTTYCLLLFMRYLFDLKNLVEERGFEKHKDQVDNCLEIVIKILSHLRNMQRRKILKTDRDLSVINENLEKIMLISRGELEDEPIYNFLSYILLDLKDNGFTFEYVDRRDNFYNRVKGNKVEILKID